MKSTNVCAASKDHSTRKKVSKSIAIHNSRELLKWLKGVESLYVEDNGKVSRKMKKLLKKRV